MRLRVGIIGLGVGEAHIQGFNAHPGATVTAICDFNPEVLAKAREKYPTLKAFTQAEALLSDPEIDVVSVASYDNHHFAQIIQALETGKHVFVEKPFCLFEEEASAISRQLRAKPQLKFSSNLILRCSPRFKELRETIQSGRLGRIFHVEGDYQYGRLEKLTQGWRGEIPFYSVIHGGGVHIVDLLMWLTGDEVLEVSAFGNRLSSQGSQFKYNDMVVAALKFKSGMTGKVAANFGCVKPHFHALEIFGTQGTFINGSPSATQYVSRDPAASPLIVETAYPGVKKGDLLFDFIDSIVVNKTPTVSVECVFRCMAVCFAIEKAVQLNQVVQVNYE